MKISLPRKPDLTNVVDVTLKLRKETKVEHLYLVKGNKAFVWLKGYRDYVIPKEEQLIRMKDAIVLHNHIQGTSFSYEDVEAIVNYNAKELRVICQNKTYIVERPGNKWNFSFEKESNYKEYQRSFNEANLLLDTLIDKRQLLEAERKDYINHFTWRIFFAKFGIKYKYFGL